DVVTVFDGCVGIGAALQLLYVRGLSSWAQCRAPGAMAGLSSAEPDALADLSARDSAAGDSADHPSSGELFDRDVQRHADPLGDYGSGNPAAGQDPGQGNVSFSGALHDRRRNFPDTQPDF